jgi:hypothetical protein
MMDMFGVLIPALLMMTAVLEINALDVVAPSSRDIKPPPPGKKAELNLTIAIDHQGYKITSAVASAFVGIPGASQNGQEIVIPLTQKATYCSRYRGTVPPPRERNRATRSCQQEEARKLRTFWVYDHQVLTETALAIKTRYPTERRIIVAPGADVEYEAIIDAMDATRDSWQPNGKLEALFDEVVMSPGG